MVRGKVEAWAIGAVAVASVFLLAGSAMARTIRVDINSTPETYEGNGQFWPNTDGAIKANQSVEGTLPFAIDFGSGNVQTFCLHQDGFVAFSSCSSIDPATVIRPLAADWQSDPAADDIFEFGAVTFSTGQLDPEPPFVPLLDAPRAIRFHWTEVCTLSPCPPDPNSPDLNLQYSFQAILIDVDGDAGGDFDIEFNYGGAIPAGTGAIGLVLGDNVRTIAGGVDNDESFDFRFRNGALVDGGTAVPEPGTMPLIALSLLTLYAIRRRGMR
jgi:hypothetical protein